MMGSVSLILFCAGAVSCHVTRPSHAHVLRELSVLVLDFGLSRLRPARDTNTWVGFQNPIRTRCYTPVYLHL
jgi:hypothetical protein